MDPRIGAGTTGIASAATTAALAQAEGLPVGSGITIALSVLTAVVGASVSYGLLKGKVDSAHARIRDEKADREKAVIEVGARIDRFEQSISREMDRQTKTIIAAIKTGADE